MHGTVHKLVYVALVGAMVTLAYAINFQYFTDSELTPFGERIRFWGMDTLCGPVRSNGQIAIMQNPVFCDYVINGASDFEHGSGFNPVFLWEIPPIHNAPALPFPDNAAAIRARAFQQGYYYHAGPNMQAWVRIRHDTLRVTWAELGEPFDSTSYEIVLLPDTATVFFDATLRVSGTVSTVLVLGASGRIGLEDNLLYASSTLPEGQPVAGHSEKFACISENEIKVLNTWANGRENRAQGADIALNGIYVALNESFTFENQNDADSGYVCTCQPDERGVIWLWGSLMQARRNYVHRSNRNGTGYGKWYRYDNELRHWNFGLFSDTLRENTVTPAAVNFGSVAVGDTVWDTIRVSNDFVPVWLTNVETNSINFLTPSDSLGYDWTHRIPVGFAPVAAQAFDDVLSLEIPYYGQTVEVPLQGIGTPLAAGDPVAVPQEFGIAAYPNPFNSRTTIEYSLPGAADVDLRLYDVTGREATVIERGFRRAGEHAVSLDGADLGTGVYFVRLAAGGRWMTAKVMLVK